MLMLFEQSGMLILISPVRFEASFAEVMTVRVTLPALPEVEESVIQLSESAVQLRLVLNEMVHSPPSACTAGLSGPRGIISNLAVSSTGTGSSRSVSSFCTHEANSATAAKIQISFFIQYTVK